MNVLDSSFNIEYVFNKYFLENREAENGGKNLNGERHMIPVDSRKQN